ncbi:MAG: DUF268 domain-containing protein [Gallionellaceae bacterium]
MSFREALLRIHWIFCTQLGINLIKAIGSIRGIIRYIRDFSRFRSSYSGKLEFVPCIHDWNEEGGATKGEYFWQDLYVAQKIFLAKPLVHVDIGSRIDGFVAHVASFREIQVFDIRPMTSTIPGVLFKQADLMDPAGVSDFCDSLSCLHTLEHFGLGRYGDSINPKGYESGFKNMVRILRSGGLFYLAVPIGEERIEFNAQHVFSPLTILTLAEINQLTFLEFSLFTNDKGLVEKEAKREVLAELVNIRYGLGIFIFGKN